MRVGGDKANSAQPVETFAFDGNLSRRRIRQASSFTDTSASSVDMRNSANHPLLQGEKGFDFG